MFAGCATYRPLPLPSTPDLSHDVVQAQPSSDALHFDVLRTHRFDPADGFDRVEFATLAVLNNPDLKASRADAGVARAQAFAAGLLPDPTLSLTRDHQLGYPEGATIAFTAGLAIDFAALLNHPVLSAAADADSRKAGLNLLWQEWQTIAQAGLLFTKVVAQEKTLVMLRDDRVQFDARWRRARSAADRGLVSSDAVTPYLTALQDVTRQINDLERQNNQSRHDLNAMIGASPEAKIALVNDEGVEHIDDRDVHAVLTDVLARRPDLAALRAGYEGEDDRYRGALIAQFPGFTFGPDRARDTTNVNTTGFALGITLPVFNRNRGNIAIEQATREKLNVEYQSRLNATVTEVDRLLREQAVLERQLAEIGSSMVELEANTSRADRAFVARNVDALVVNNAHAALLARQVEQINAAEALTEQRIALQTLIGPDDALRDRP